MNLYISTYILAAVSAALGWIFAVGTQKCQGAMMSFLRSKKAAVVTFGLGGLWFLYQLSQLGEADFGQIKGLLIAVFGIAGVLAFFFLDDFLSVRGVCVIVLLAARTFLDGAFMQPPQSRLVLVTLTYVWIVAAIYFGAVPYRLRDAFEYLYENKTRAKTLGWIFFACAALLAVSSIFY